ncbi:CsgG/HfaB family protein [Ideonella oryzae]|uniref:CsgG/HfaB family protein n=1 Tax=Ideonella oryzae TaxID=2937441 RepID=A0ABT1BNR6_9BURK|nr:CsgG/HfaB family protein [Ideonella oryzae]MCO5977798.1 CsgG/HfaB family protein [Ideonella oryzae]
MSIAAPLAWAADAPPPPTLAHCDAPVASVMVGKMQCKAANGNNGGAGACGLAALLQMADAANGGLSNVSGIADGIKDVLVTALSESGCFEVQDREQLDEIAKELELAGKKVQTQQAEFLISGAVTQIDVSTENKSFGAGLPPFVGSIGTKTQKAAVALDMKLVCVETAKVVASKRATASTEDSSFSVGGFGGSLSSLKGTNLEAVTKDAIVQSVNFLVDAARGARTASVAGAQPTP